MNETYKILELFNLKTWEKLQIYYYIWILVNELIRIPFNLNGPKRAQEYQFHSVYWIFELCYKCLGGNTALLKSSSLGLYPRVLVAFSQKRHSTFDPPLWKNRTMYSLAFFPPSRMSYSNESGMTTDFRTFWFLCHNTPLQAYGKARLYQSWVIYATFKLSFGFKMLKGLKFSFFKIYIYISSFAKDWKNNCIIVYYTD